MSLFGEIEKAPQIEVFALNRDYRKDPAPNKVNLSIGAYRTDHGEPWVLPCVRSVEASIVADETLNKEYLPITGSDALCESSIKLILGENHSLINEKKVESCQTLGGTGAIYLGLQFSKHCGCSTVYVSNPTWPNHKHIAKFVGLDIREYRYWDQACKAIDFSGMKDDLSNAPERSIIVLHACAHNPTGVDPSKEEWEVLADLIQSRKLIPLFDIAYQGFASGDLDKDAWAIRYFAARNIEMLIAQSFSKNFGLYNERVGVLHVVSNDPLVAENASSQLKVIVRRTWSNPPQHGALVVSKILSDPRLHNDWISNVQTMAERIRVMRQKLLEKLISINTPGNWDHIVTQSGMFSYSGLTKQQVDYLRSTYHIYIMSDGRINMCGLTPNNIEYVANAIRDSVTKFPSE